MQSNNIFLKKSNGELVATSRIDGLAVFFKGKGSYVVIEDGSVFVNSVFYLGDYCSVEVSKTHRWGIQNTQIDMTGTGRNKKLTIGKECSISSCRFAMVNEGDLEISIGENCMMSSNIVFRATDGHAIFDNQTKKMINKSKPIIIGNNVWIGASVLIMKGTKIADNTVVGGSAVVSKVFTKSNIIIGGNPSKIIKENVTWSRDFIS